MNKLTFFTRAALLILATSWLPGLAAPVPAPTDFWVRDQPGRITHACGGKEPLVLCMQGRKVVMQVQSDRTNGFSYTARFFNLQKEVEKKQALFVAGRESTPEVRVNDQPWKSEFPSSVTFDGLLTLTYPEAGGVVVTRTVYPSMTKALVIEEWQVRNTTGKRVVVTVAPARTVKPVEENIAIVWSCPGVKTAAVKAGGVLSFSTCVQAGLAAEPDLAVNVATERGARLALAEAAWRGPGRLETPEPLLDHAFALQKLHVLESPIETFKGVITHNGSLTYSPGIWANDPPEYSSPLFPFFGDAELNKASMNMYRVWLDYSREHGDAIPGCFWQPTLQVGQWERGDDAMILYGLSKFLLFQGDRAAAEEMWPLIERCAASVLRHTTAEGIVASKSDEMEDRYPTGDANLSTSSLAYGGYRQSACLARALGKPVAAEFDQRADKLGKAIESFFGGEVEGFKTYRYYKENTVLRGWILLPLAMGITERQNATLDAMVSDKLWPNRMQGGDILAASDRRETEWGRETYYALRVLFKAGRTEEALDLTRRVVKAQIFGTKGPYPDEDAIDMLCPGSLYPRVFIEGMFGIVPNGLDSFECTPWLPTAWPRMALRDLRAFGQSWDLVVERVGDQQKVTVLSGGKMLLTGFGPAGKTYTLTFPVGTLQGQAKKRADLTNDFVKPPMKFRSRPLWFWNNTEVTAAGIEEQMVGCRDRDGYGGLAPLPFGPKFKPEYLSKAYFEFYGETVKKAKELGMFITIYDEYGFPSGSAGAMMGDGIPRFKNKYPDATLRRLDKHEETVSGPTVYSKPLVAGKLMSLVAMNTATLERVDLAAKASNGALSWDVPAGTWKIMTFVCVLDGDPNVDYLEPEHVTKFIDMVYQPYYDKFGKDFGSTVGGAFYDEPTLYRAQGRTWTDRFNEKFQAARGFSPTAYYPALWYDIGPDTQAARNALFGFRSELYAAGYVKTIQDWCTAHGGVPLLGHQDQENVKNPVGISGDLMKSYRYQDVPGIDKIGWNNDPEGYYKIVSSVAYNWDKAQVMTETYGAMGNLSWDRLYAIVMEQYAKGINNFVQHGVWYNLDKINYLPELSYRNPLYADGLYAYNTYIGRLNVLLQAPGRHVADIAVLYPISTLQAGYRFDGLLTPYIGGVDIPEADYIHLGELLSTKVCRDFTFLHPETLDDRCTVAADTLKLNNTVNHEDYKVVILPGHKTIRWSNLQKIKEFYDHGGKVIATGQLPDKSAEFDHDADVVATIHEMFPKVEHQILATANSEWRGTGAYEAMKAIDGSLDTHWAPSEEEAKEWWLAVDFHTARTFNTIRIREESNRVTAYEVEYWNGSDWITCASGTTLGADKVDKFEHVTASRIRLAIKGVSSRHPAIREFEVHHNDGPNLVHSEALIVQQNAQGGRTIYLNSPNESSLRQALDQALQVYDVDMTGTGKLRYIHRVMDDTDIYFFANLDDRQSESTVRLRGKFTPELWDPHTGAVTVPEFTNAIENDQPITQVKLTLGPVRSSFIIAKPRVNL